MAIRLRILYAIIAAYHFHSHTTYASTDRNSQKAFITESERGNNEIGIDCLTDKCALADKWNEIRNGPFATVLNYAFKHT